MPRPTIRQAVILVSSAVALFYLVYRAAWTLNLTSPYAVFASLFLYAGEFYGVLTMLLYFLQVWDTTEPPEQPVLKGRTVDVFVPTYNEDPDILRTTLQACVNMRYPHRTYLCDDGGTEARLKDPQKGPAAAERAATLRAVCDEVGAIYTTRLKNEHAKAGNLNYAFGKTDGEFIIIFDADHVPDPNFITRLLGYFADEKLAFVQTPHAFYNFDSFQARLDHDRKQYWEEGQLFYHVIQTGRNYWNAPIFAGSAALFRRKALAEVGYIATETITEDMHTGLRMHGRGWKSLGISARMISGQAAQDVTTFHSQRLRWGEGNLSVLAHDNPLTTRGLSWGQRLCYLGTMINWCGGLFKLPIYLTPLLMLLTGVPPVAEFTWLLASIMAAYMAVSILGTKYVSNGYGSIWYSELFMMASFWTQVRGSLRAAFLRKLQQFVVTAKRGRQSNSIWPYIRPQAYLIAASAFALLWAWGRVWLGISDDCFKPLLATFWAFFHVLLAYLVVRRSLWPDDNRFSTRHLVHLPVGYEVEGAGPGAASKLGVSADLNERGLGFVAYERLPRGAKLRLALYAPAETVQVEGTVCWCTEVAGAAGGFGPEAGFRYGVAFQDLDSARVDALNRVGLHYAVPRLYGRYAEGHRRLIDVLASALAAPFRRRRFAPRREYHLPLFLDFGDGPELPAVTEDLSRTFASVLLHGKVDTGAEAALALHTPLGVLQGRARVTACRPQVFAARTYWLCVLEFTHFEGQGWEALQALCGGPIGERLRPVLAPARRPRAVPMNRPLAAALLLLVPLAGLEFGLFRWFYRDDFFLRGVASGGAVTADDVARVDRIYEDVMAEGYPATDRLVLLSRVLQRVNRPAALAEVVKRLAPRDRDNLDLQLALAHAYASQDDFEHAEAEYARLLAALDRGRVAEARREELLVAAARNAAHAGHLDLAARRFRVVLQAWPDRPQYRNEIAGALLAGNRLDEAAHVFDGVEPDRDGRVMLALVHAAAGRHDAAEREARALLRRWPGDPAAQGLLADVLSLRGQHLQAQAIYQRLLAGHGANLKILVQLAHGSLWNHNYQEALERFQAILDRHLNDPRLAREHPEVVRAYVNAAAGAPRLGKAQAPTVLRLYERALAEAAPDAVFLARLGWVLHRLGEDGKSAAVLERAASPRPADPALCRQLAAGFLAAGRPEMARKLLEGSGDDLEARTLLAEAYVQNRDFAAAAAVCRAVLRDYPDHAPTRARLADVLSWNKEYAESLRLFEELARRDPKNAVYPVRLAEVALWSGDTAAALARYEGLLRADFRRPALWWDFVDAAAAAPRLNAAQAALVRAIRDEAVEGGHRAPAVLAAFRRDGREPAECSFLTRLAWALIEHARDPRRAEVLLDRALALRPTRPAQRKELAGVLAAAGRFAEALKLYEGLPLDTSDRLQLARVHAGLGDYEAAAGQCHLILKAQPLHQGAQILLADVLAWQQRFPEALERFRRLRDAHAADDYLIRRQAEVTLDSGDAARALELFEDRLARNLEQPLLWRGFLEAAGRSPALTPRQKDLARRVTARPVADEPRNIALLSEAAWVLYHHLGDKARAGTLLLRAVLLNCEEPGVLTRLAWVLHAVGDPANRDVVLKRAVALRPRSPHAREGLARVLAATGHAGEARALFQELARAAPHDAGVQTALAELALAGGDYAEALGRLEGVAGPAKARGPRWRRLFADAAAGAARLTEVQARLLVEAAGEPVPPGTISEQAVYLSRLSWALLRAADRGSRPALRERALALLDQAVSLKPAEARVRRELTGVLLAAGRARAALPWLEELARATPNDRALQRQLAEATLWAGDHAGALRRLEALLKAEPADPVLRARFADAAAAAPRGAMTPAQVALARRLAGRRAAAGPDEALCLSRLAWALLRENCRAEALAALDAAVALRPRDARARRELAGVLTAAGRHREALPWLEELARAAPNDAALRRQLAEATLWSGDSALALRRLQEVLAADFEQPALWEHYVSAASGLNKGTLTREQIELARRIAARPVPPGASSKVLFLTRLAWVLHREGHAADAGPLLDRAVALKPADARARRELAGVLLAAGRHEAGLRLFDGLTLTLEDHHQLVLLHAEARQFAEAEKHCRAILREAPGNRRAREWLAHLALWGTDYARAVSLYQALLEADPGQAALWPGYVEAASMVEKLTPAQVRLVRAVFDRAGATAAEPVFLARLALVLDRHVERPARLPGLSAGLLGLAAGPPAGPLPAVLIAAADAGVPTPARRLLLRALERRPRDATGLARLAWLVHEMGFVAHAARVLDEAIALRPAEPAVRREVGDVLVATGRLKEGLRWFEELAEAFPDSRELLIRRAEVTVWAGEFARGLDRVEKVLGPDLGPQSLWHTFVDAASSAPRLSRSQAELARKLAERPVPVRGAEARAAYLSRLAWSLFREAGRAGDKDWLPAVNRLLDEAVRLRPASHDLRLEVAGVLTALRRYGDAAALYEGLARDFPGETEPRVRLAELALWGGDPRGGLARFERLWRKGVRPARVWAGFVDAASAAPALSRPQAELARTLADGLPAFVEPGTEAQYLARLSWVLVREGKAAGNAEWARRAVALLDRAVALRPADPRVGRELAGVLAAADQHRAGLKLFEGRALDAEDRFQLAVLHAGLRQFDEAEQHLRAVLAQRPGDRRARQWLAQVTLWRGRSAEALQQLEERLREDFNQPVLWRAYATALANVPRPTPRQIELALRVAAQPAGDGPDAVPFLTRLAWGLYREGKRAGDARLMERAGALAGQAVTLRPRSGDARRELAGVLAALGKAPAAWSLLEGLEPRDGDRRLRVSLLAADHRLDEAEAEARRLVEDRPKDDQARLLLADVLGWNHQAEEAAQIYRQLLRANGADQGLRRRLAEVTLWSGDFDKALALYREVLAADWRQPELWPGYVDAAASAREVPAGLHRHLLLRIAAEATGGKGHDAVYLTRLSWVLRRLGEASRAVDVLRCAVQQAPDSRDMRARLAEALQAAGQYTEAERHYEYLLRTAPRR